MTSRTRIAAPLLTNTSTLGEMKRAELKRKMKRRDLLSSPLLTSSPLTLNLFIHQWGRGDSRFTWQNHQLRVTHPHPKSSTIWRTLSPWSLIHPSESEVVASDSEPGRGRHGRLLSERVQGDLPKMCLLETVTLGVRRTISLGPPHRPGGGMIVAGNGRKWPT